MFVKTSLGGFLSEMFVDLYYGLQETLIRDRLVAEVKKLP